MTVFANDPDLLRRFRKGERSALAHVYDRYVGVIESLIRRGFVSTSGAPVPGGVRPADVADLLQEVFVKAFGESARLKYDGLREYRPFLVAIARNVIIDHCRLRGREVYAELAIEQLGEQGVMDVHVEGPWADAQTMLLVERYLAELPAGERAVYVQRYVLCRSQTEAALALGLSRQQLRTVEARLRHGLARNLAHADAPWPASDVTRPEPRPNAVRHRRAGPESEP